MKKENQPEMITQSAVLEMGWTKTLITRYLPEPVLRTNHIYRCAAPLKLFDKKVVLEIMETEEVKAALEKAKKRKESAQIAALKGVETKTRKLTERIMENVSNIKIKVLPDDELRELTFESKRSWYWEHERYEDLDVENADEETIQRWVVNFIRHELITFYDDSLGCLDGKVGKFDAYETYKTEILRMIAKKYPKYADECERQIIGAYTSFRIGA